MILSKKCQEKLEMSLKTNKIVIRKPQELSIKKNASKQNVLEEFSLSSPLPMQYLGSKGRISRWIINTISKDLPNANTIIDLFAGTGAVSLEALHQGYGVIANDVQPYSFAILNSLFYAPKRGIKNVAQDLNKFVTKRSVLLKGQRRKLEEALIAEDKFFSSFSKGELDWRKYKKFCDNVERYSEPCQHPVKRNQYNLFSWYYPNTYFGIRQCLEIDAIREFADTLPTHSRSHVLASVISALTYNVSSTTHLAQFLKPNSQKQAETLIKKRSKSILESVNSRLQMLSSFSVPSADKILNLDYLDALEKIDPSKNIVVYADPPYFKEHYSRYYHVLDTFYLYDYPDLSLNPQTKKITEGKYRANRIVSDFGLRSKVSKAFAELLQICNKKGFLIVISYANTSLIDKTEMKAIIADNGYKIISIKEKDLMHSGQGQKNKIAQEYLFTLSPK